jgi:hypothetical protein
MSAFSNSCFVLIAMDGKIEQFVCIKFCVKLGKSAAETLEMLLENILYAGQLFLNGIHVSRLVKCQLKMTNVQGDQAPPKRPKMLKKLENYPRRPSPNKS